MNKHVGVPLSSDAIPANTGLVQSIECRGAKRGSTEPALELPVIAQITTFANGIRHVCCSMANPHSIDGIRLCRANPEAGTVYCTYAWKNPEK